MTPYREKPGSGVANGANPRDYAVPETKAKIGKFEILGETPAGLIPRSPGKEVTTNMLKGSC